MGHAKRKHGQIYRLPVISLLQYIISCAPLLGAEYILQETPRTATAEDVGGKQTLVCDWGAVSTTVSRTGQDCDHDYDALMAYMQSDEWLSLYQQMLKEGMAREAEMAKAAIAKKLQEYNATPQSVDMPMQANVTTRVVDLANWQRRIPLDIRSTLRVAVCDFSQPEHIAWLIAQVRAYPSLQVFTTAWNSQAEVDAIVAHYPELAQVIRVRHIGEGTDKRTSYRAEEWLTGWQVRALPALIRFIDLEHAQITEGLAP